VSFRMDSLLGRQADPPLAGEVSCHCDVQRRNGLWKLFRTNSNAIPDRANAVRLPAGITVRVQRGIVFVFSPDCRSRPSRNGVRFRPESAVKTRLRDIAKTRVDIARYLADPKSVSESRAVPPPAGVQTNYQRLTA
jgi:hypothetical protein